MPGGEPEIASIAARVADSLVGADPHAAPSAAAVGIGGLDGGPITLSRGYAQTLDADGRPLAIPEPLHSAAIFDVGSVTKIAATTTLCMALVDAGRLSLDAQLQQWFPDFVGDGKDVVTVRDLLEHQAGLWEWWPTYVDGGSTPQEALSVARRLPLRYPPGTGRRYSDLGFMLLGEIMAREYGTTIDDAARREVFEPLGMTDTAYRPRGAAEPTGRVVATSVGDWYERRMVETGSPYPVTVDPSSFTGWREHTLVGQVNDGNSWHAFGGVAGHAGVFTTVADLLRLGTTLLSSLEDAGPWSSQVVGEFIRPGRDDEQGLGFWLQQRGSELSVEHSGFTGARFAVLPRLRRVVVLLTNRQHGTGEPVDVGPAWEALVTAVAEESS